MEFSIQGFWLDSDLKMRLKRYKSCKFNYTYSNSLVGH